MTLEQFKQLEPDLVTRAIAEVVCGWEYIKPRQYWTRAYYALPNTDKKNYRWADEGHFNDHFQPLTSIDDAVLCVEKLDGIKQQKWAEHLTIKQCGKVWSEFEGARFGVQDAFYLANSSAFLRCLALWNTLPELDKRYQELEQPSKKGGVSELD